MTNESMQAGIAVMQKHLPEMTAEIEKAAKEAARLPEPGQ
jgi:hypothetical protein